jgi:integral membrane sensor domain MASE1
MLQDFLNHFVLVYLFFIVVFVCMNIFISIINESFRQARENIHRDQKIYSFMPDRFLRWTGKCRV